MNVTIGFFLFFMDEFRLHYFRDQLVACLISARLVNAHNIA